MHVAGADRPYQDAIATVSLGEDNERVSLLRCGPYCPKPKVVLIAMAARLGEGQHALVDPLPAGFRDLMSYPSQWGSLAPRGRQFGWSTIGRPNGVKDALKARIFAAANK